jgi:hypothetical protein
MLMQALIATSISVLYKYIILLQWVSHNLKSIQRLLLKSAVWWSLSSLNSLTQTSWTENLLSMSVWQQQRLREMQNTMSVRRKWQSVIQNDCACNVKKVNILLKSANFYWLYNLKSSMLLQLRLQRRQQRQMRTQKRVAFSESCSWECMRCDKSWKKFENRWTVLFYYVNINQ